MVVKRVGSKTVDLQRSVLLEMKEVNYANVGDLVCSNPWVYVQTMSECPPVFQNTCLPHFLSGKHLIATVTLSSPQE